MRRRAFTLIELMIVVAIIAMIAAILIPSLLRARETSRRRSQQGAGPVVAAATPETPAETGAAPDLTRLQADMRLKHWTTRSGMDVTSRYQLSYVGRLRVTVPEGKGPYQLRIPFPRQTEEALNVKLRFQQGERNWEPSDWTVSRWGLVAPLNLPAGQSLEAEVQFEAIGRDRMRLDLPPARKLGRLQMQLTNEDLGSELSESSLQPQQTPAAGHYRWDLENLVSQSPILVDMPGSHSLMGRIMLLCRLAGLAVLLFGLGFWYVGELYRPGCLSRFGWGHFLMLALTYTSFFPALCVLTLSQGLPLAQGLAVAAALAQPLLLIHVWRSVNLRFSLFYVLPLADLTLAVVVNGVFGGPWREAIFLGFGFLAMALMTMTFPRWRSNRLAWQRSQIRELQTRLQDLSDQAEDLARLAGTKPQLILPTHPFSEAEALSAYVDRLRPEDYSGVRARADQLERLLERTGQTVKRARPAPPRQPSAHCTSCGQAGCTGTFCSACGQARALPVHCSCGSKVWFPPMPQKECYCPDCGSKHASAPK
jgi:type IV pilus assembly protein PilA